MPAPASLIGRLVHACVSATIAVLLLAMAAAQAGIYKWQDAEGNTHYGDSPPPGVAVPASQAPSTGPMPGHMSDAQREALAERFVEACRDGVESTACRQLRREVSRELQKDCAPEWRGEPCARVHDEYVLNLADEVAAHDPAAEAAGRAADEARVAQLKERDCAQQRDSLAALKRMGQGVRGEILTPEERAGLPARISELEARLARDCR